MAYHMLLNDYLSNAIKIELNYGFDKTPLAPFVTKIMVTVGNFKNYNHA